MTEWVIRAFFIGLGSTLAIWFIIRFKSAYEQYRLGNLYKMGQEEKSIEEANRRLSDNDLLEQHNAWLRSKSVDPDKKG